MTQTPERPTASYSTQTALSAAERPKRIRVGLWTGGILAIAAVVWGATAINRFRHDAAAEESARQQLVEFGAIAMKGTDRQHVETLKLTMAKHPDKLNDAVENLQYLTHLLHLDISELPIVDTHLQAIRNLSRLRSLILSNTHITDAGVDTITELPLETLQLARTSVTPAVFSKLGKIESLIVLELSGNSLGDDWSGLLGLQKLEWLVYTDGRLGPGAADAIAAIPNLARLTITHTEIAAGDLTKIKIAKPAIKIEGAVEPAGSPAGTSPQPSPEESSLPRAPARDIAIAGHGTYTGVRSNADSSFTANGTKP